MPDSPPAGRAIETTLRDVFGYPEFRLHQREIIEHVIEGGDAFVLMPTGGGKSLCYQIPALHRPGTAIVVSPLISLMKDQVDALVANGVAAACLNSSLEEAEARRVFGALMRGELDLLYVAPERLMLDGFLEHLDPVPLALFAIDEAHCVSQWGHDFRPEYIQLGRLRGLFPDVPLVALTATADEQTRQDVRRRLGIADAPMFAAGFDRPNIRYVVQEKWGAFAQLKAFLAEHPGESGIVYCLSRKRTEQVAGKLAAAGVASAAYHAGLSARERTRVQDAFLGDDIEVVVATVAFGMGIDKPDVRFVVHYDMPKSIESYYQETGRAGRDGLPATALMLFGLNDVVTARRLIESGEAPDQVRIDLHKLSAMVGLAESTTCRRRVMLGYFGERMETEDGGDGGGAGGDGAGGDATDGSRAVEPPACGNCDVCIDPPELFDATVDAQKVLSAVHRLRERFGIAHVVDVLRGADTEKIRARGHDLLPTYGAGADRSHEQWMGIIRQLIHLGYLKQDIADYSTLKLAPAAAGVLRGESEVRLAEPRLREASRAGAKAAKAAAAAERRKRRDFDGADVDADLFERLRALRRRLAAEQSVPAYVVFADAALIAMASLRPGTPEEFLEVPGVGQAKLERYGETFLAEIAGGAKLL
jgi:ATP-dependent DNA helicase RecQ